MSENNNFSFIQNEITNNDIVLFMKGTKNFPQCKFSDVVVKILQNIGVQFHDINILSSPELREDIKLFSDWPTIPQLYIKGEFIGGCDIVNTLYQDGELIKILKKKQIEIAETK